MSKSQNGWPASPTLRTRVLKVAGISLRIVDDDDVASVFGYVAAQFNARVESLPGKVADDWGFAYRANRNNPNSLSNHSSGTAIDLNATQHPNSVATARTFTAAEIAEVRKIVAECDGVVRWGGDYHGTPDAMHFEINVPPGSPKLAALAERLRGDRAEPKPAPKPAPAPKPKRALILHKAVTPGGTDPQVRVLQQLLIDAGYGPIKGAPSDYYGENTQAAVARFHRENPKLSSGTHPDVVIGRLGFKLLQEQAADRARGRS